jgi:hypothetical protein
MMQAMPWQAPLVAPADRDHVVQLYTDDAFVVRSVTYFARRGLRAGDALVLIATPAHLGAIGAALASAGIDVAERMARKQLVLLEAEACLTRFMTTSGLDRAAFAAVVADLVARTRAAGFGRVRFFGEMVDLLLARRPAAALELEAEWSAALAEHSAALLCVYRIDNFDRRAHRDLLPDVCRQHSHVIPVEDYARLDRAVALAYGDVFGERGDAAELRARLVARHAPPASMPRGQAALLALREVHAGTADAVLARARHHYHA